jgi:hypothetical protein
MKDLLDRIMARYPRVAKQCYETASIWLAEELATLEEGQSLRRGGDEILSGLAQAVSDSGIDPEEMADSAASMRPSCGNCSHFPELVSC